MRIRTRRYRRRLHTRRNVSYQIVGSFAVRRRSFARSVLRTTLDRRSDYRSTLALVGVPDDLGISGRVNYFIETSPYSCKAGAIHPSIALPPATWNEGHECPIFRLLVFSPTVVAHQQHGTLHTVINIMK